jgi:cytochrome c553
MEKATGILRRKRKTSKKIPMIPTLTGSMTEYLVQGFEDFHQKDQTDRNGTEGDEVSKGVKRQM